MAVTAYTSAPLTLNAHVWSTSYGVLLVGSGYTLDRDAHVYVSDVAGELTTMTSYTRKAIAGPTTSLGTHLVNFEANNETWTAVGGTVPGTIYAAIVYYNSGADATSGLVAHYALTSPVTTNGGDFVLKWNAGSSAGAVFQMVATVV